MPARLRFNSILVTLLAFLFITFFNVTKHNPVLSPVNPFAEDPFDAIGSFGIQAALFLGLLSLVRAFKPYPPPAPTEGHRTLLARTEMLSVLAVGVTLGGDLVGMARYPLLWVGSSAGHDLAALLGGLVMFTVAAGVLVYRSIGWVSLTGLPGRWGQAGVVCLATIFVLTVYPDALRLSTPGALFTVLLGATALFAPMRFLGMALIPYETEARISGPPTVRGWLTSFGYPALLVLLAGCLLGVMVVIAESTEGGAAPHLAGLAFVAAVYVGLESTGLLIGYVFLRHPLGYAHLRLTQHAG